MSDILSWIRLTGPFLIGHRGFPRVARENTIPSFEAALEAGCDGVELDVRMTGDGVLVVHHDSVAHGPTGSLEIEHTPWETLRAARFEADGEEYSVGRLDDVLRALAGRCLVNVEVKAPAAKAHVGVAQALHPILDRVRPRESLLVSSFDPEVLAAVRATKGGVILGFLCSTIQELNHLEESEVVDGLVAVHPRHDLVDEGFMKRVRERGLDVHVWTVDEPEEARRVVSLGVNSVITNRPDLCSKVLYEGLPPA